MLLGSPKLGLKNVNSTPFRFVYVLGGGLGGFPRGLSEKNKPLFFVCVSSALTRIDPAGTVEEMGPMGCVRAPSVPAPRSVLIRGAIRHGHAHAARAQRRCAVSKARAEQKRRGGPQGAPHQERPKAGPFFSVDSKKTSHGFWFGPRGGLSAEARGMHRPRVAHAACGSPRP